MERIRIVIIDDQYLFLKSLKSVIESLCDDIEVVGLAHDGVEGIELVIREKPDVALVDIRMPGMDGVEVTRILTNEEPDTRIVVLTTFEDDKYVRKCIEYGAFGYLLKDISPEHLITAIRAVPQGMMQMSPSAAMKLAKENFSAGPKIGVDSMEDIDKVRMYNSLSEKEQQILEHVYLGLRTGEIARKVYLAPQTVRNYISDMYNKLGLRDRNDLRHFYDEIRRLL